MSSVVVYEHGTIVVEWNKNGHYTLRDGVNPARYYSKKGEALKAARRLQPNSLHNQKERDDD